MVENVQIVNKNGDSMFAEGIAYIQNDGIGKKYIMYTLNEKVDNDLTKIYIAEASDEPGQSAAIPDEEWQAFRQLMVKITHNEPVENIKCLSMNDVSLNIGDPKKVALTAVATQSFRDFQSKNMINNAAVDAPVTEGSANVAPAVEQPVAEQPAVEVPTAPVAEQPVVEAPSAPVAEQPVVEAPPAPVMEQPVVETPSAPVVEQPVVEAPSAPVAEQPVVEAPAAPVVEQPVVEAPAAPVVEQPVVEQPVIQENVLGEEPVLNNAGVEERIITDEEALQAINIIQEYLQQEKNQ